jgi:uncharacterized protein YxeA
MKRIFIILIAVIVLICLSSCNNNEEACYADSETVLDIQYDQYKNVISKVVYDNRNERTYLYTYTYSYQNGFWECTDSNLTIVLRGGTVVYPKE